jgi:hypothetical protein
MLFRVVRRLFPEHANRYRAAEHEQHADDPTRADVPLRKAEETDLVDETSAGPAGPPMGLS